MINRFSHSFKLRFLSWEYKDKNMLVNKSALHALNTLFVPFFSTWCFFPSEAVGGYVTLILTSRVWAQNKSLWFPSGKTLLLSLPFTAPPRTRSHLLWILLTHLYHFYTRYSDGRRGKKPTWINYLHLLLLHSFLPRSEIWCNGLQPLNVDFKHLKNIRV